MDFCLFFHILYVWFINKLIYIIYIYLWLYGVISELENSIWYDHSKPISLGMTLNFHLTVSWISVDLQLVELRFTSSWSNFYGSLSCCSFPQTWNSWTHRTRRTCLGAWFLACSSQWICWAFALVPSFWGCGAALEPLGFCRWVFFFGMVRSRYWGSSKKIPCDLGFCGRIWDI